MAGHHTRTTFLSLRPLPERDLFLFYVTWGDMGNSFFLREVFFSAVT